jgi:hypothetical protein
MMCVMTRATMGPAGRRVQDAPLPCKEMECRFTIVFWFSPSGCSSLQEEGRGTRGQGWAGPGRFWCWHCRRRSVSLNVVTVVIAGSTRTMPSRGESMEGLRWTTSTIDHDHEDF